VAGALAIWLDARREARGAAGLPWLRTAPVPTLLALLSLAAAGATLGLEARRRALPLEVHPRPLVAELRGFVSDASAAAQEPAHLAFDVVSARVGEREENVTARVRMRWPVGSPPPAWAVSGTPLAARGVARALEDARNPGGSPPGRWLEREGTDATFDVAPGSVEPWLPPGVTAGRDRRSGARLAAEARRAVGRLLDAHAPPVAAALARGMLLGDRVGVDAETRESFRNAGTLHILSISGLHVCIAAGLVAFLARGLGLGAVTGTLAEFAALAAYVAFVGAPAPALRSALLWVFARGARLAGRGGPPLAGWSAAGLLLHLADPALPHDLGFLLSFGAVLGLEAGAALAPRKRADAEESARRRWGRGIIAAVAGGAGAAAGTLPLEIAAFGAFPVAGPVANLVVIPLTSLFLAEAVLLATLGGILPAAIADLLGGSLGALADALLLANDQLGGRIDPIPVHAAPSVAAATLSYAALLAIASRCGPSEVPRGTGDGRGLSRHRRPLSFALLAIALGAPFLLSRGGGADVPRALFLDVGQGDAALLLDAEGDALAIDAGPRSARRDEGRLSIEPALRSEGVRGRVKVLASHGHRDHEGGVVGLAARGWVERVYENGGVSADRDEWRREVMRRGGTVVVVDSTRRRVRAGAWSVDVAGAGAVAAPPAAVARVDEPTAPRSSANAAENDRSLVAVATLSPAAVPRGAPPHDEGNTFSILFPGDLEEGGEAAWLKSGLGRATILKVPHHGSRTSSSPEWVSRTVPRAAVVSVGERNRHRHPSPETLRRYRRGGARVLRTDREGAVRVTATPAGLKLSTRAHPQPQPLDGAGSSGVSHCFDFP
jgi:competence protein ComEC